MSLLSLDIDIDDLIVPAAVTRGYLTSYKPAFIATIMEVYAQVEKAQLAKVKDIAPMPGASPFVLVAGSHGVGKTHLVDRLVERRANTTPYVICDVDAILPYFPAFNEEMNQISGELQYSFEMGAAYSTAMHREKIEEVTEKFRPAAKFISDRLMTFCVRQGIPVIVETNAKTPFIGSFIDSINNSGAVLETHICQAPLAIKKAGFRAAHHHIGIKPEQIEAEHIAMMKNMPVIAAGSTGNLTLHWRQDPDAGLMPAAVATAGDYTIDLVAHTGFNAYFIDHGQCVAKLMGSRRLIQPAPLATPLLNAA